MTPKITKSLTKFGYEFGVSLLNIDLAFLEIVLEGKNSFYNGKIWYFTSFMISKPWFYLSILCFYFVS